MGVRKISSHFILLPGGKIGKWPLITFNSAGKILTVETHPEGLREEPGLELFGGLLIPGLVDIAPIDSEQTFNTRDLNRHFASGTALIGVYHATTASKKNNLQPPFLTGALPAAILPHAVLYRSGANAEKPILQRILHQDFNHNFIELLYLASEWGANQTEFKDILGKLEPEFSPGLIVLQNINLPEFKPTLDTKVKWLINPSLNTSFR